MQRSRVVRSLRNSRWALALEPHRQEFDLFDERVRHETRFRGLTYQRVFERLRDSGQAGFDYLNYLESRYFPVLVRGVGTGRVVPCDYAQRHPSD